VTNDVPGMNGQSASGFVQGGLGDKCCDFIIAHIGEDNVLIDGEADLTVGVLIRNVCNLSALIRT
jgi:hypothetical protein